MSAEAAQVLYALFEHLRDYLAQIGLVMGRAYGIISVFPVFTKVRLSQLIKFALAGALSIPLIEPFSGALLPEIDKTVVANFLLVAKEFFVGIILGFFMGLPIWAIISAGDIIDNQRELANADIEDPSSGGSVSAMAALFGFVATTSFFVLGGGPILASVLYGSFAFWPIDVFRPDFSQGAAGILLSVLAEHLILAIMLASPFLALSLLSDISVAALSRASPKMLSFSSGPLIKNLIFSLVLILYTTVLVTQVDTLLPGADRVRDLMEQGFRR